MAEVTTSDGIKMEDMDIENLKVADLKKKLKDFGLSVSGNKPDLVERLQEHLLALKSGGTTDPGGSELVTEEDSALLHDGSNDLDEKDSLNVPEDEFSFSSPEKRKESGMATSTPANIPLKKRVIAQNSAETSEKPKPKEKKIVLKRNHIPTPKFIPNKPAEPLKLISAPTDDEIDVAKKEDNKEETVGENDKEGANKVIRLGTKNLTEEERITLRAKRFNITAPEPSSKSGKVSITSRQTSEPKTSSSASILTPLTSAPTLDLLKKRAQRFGENVSSMMKQLEYQQKVLKRKSKFSDCSSVGNGLDEQEKKKKRAERFGIQ